MMSKIRYSSVDKENTKVEKLLQYPNEFIHESTKEKDITKGEKINTSPYLNRR